MKGLAINIGANSNIPGFRGPVYNDGSFEYIPIPEREETWWKPPKYGDLGLDYPPVEDVKDMEVHLDPQFQEYPCCSDYVYGDEHGVKSGRISNLGIGDYLFFYATLDKLETGDWGAYLIGHFRLGEEPLIAKDHLDVPGRYRCNAHYFRKEFDADIVVRGDAEDSCLYQRCIGMSGESGDSPGWIVRDLSSDSGKGPWWRRPMWFDEGGINELLKLNTDI